MPAIRVRVGVLRAAQQRQPQHMAQRVVAVLAVVEQADAIARLRQVGPAVAADLELLLVPRCVAVRGPLHRAELDLIGRAGRAHVDRERGLEHDLALLPVGLGDEVDARHAVVDDDVLDDAAGAVGAGDAHRPAHRPGLDDLDPHVGIPRILAARIGQVNVPRGLALRPVLEQLQPVGGLARGDDLALRGLVQQPDDGPVRGQLDDEEGVLQALGRDRQAAAVRRGRGAHSVGRIAERGQPLGRKRDLRLAHVLRGRGPAVRPDDLPRRVRGMARGQRGQRDIDARPAQAVERDDLVAARGRGKGAQRSVAHAGRGPADRGVIDRGLGVHLADGAAGQDIVELEQQEILPRRVQRAGVHGRALHGGQAAEDLRLAQQQLVLAVGPLGRGLRRVGAAVRLQIEFADPGGQRRVRHAHVVEVLLLQPLAARGDAGVALRAARGFDHGIGRPAAAVAVAV